MTFRPNQRQRALGALYRGKGLPRLAGARPRVAVVGAGLAGLSAAHLLDMGGCEVAVFEAGDRVGGRIRTEVDASGRIWELGGEFIDSDHHDMRALVSALDLPLIDMHAPGEQALMPRYRFGGRDYDEARIDAAFAQIAPRITADVNALGRRPNCRASTAAARRLDRLSVEQYLDGLEMEGWLRTLISVAYVTLYGSDAGEQSALNLLTMIGGSGDFKIFGASDERFKLRDGSRALTDGLASRLEGRVHLDRRLVRLGRDGAGWRLSLAGAATGAVEVAADVVVLAVPFTLLREVELDVPLPPAQRRALDQLGYGDSSKLMLALRDRPWRDAGFEAGAYTDSVLQSTWDASRQRADTGSVLTVFQGGAPARATGAGDADMTARRMAGLAGQLFPGVDASWTGEFRRAYWPGEPLARGGYTCYRPGQWSDFGGAEGMALPGGLHFAGEHCAAASQGYMNGAAESGRKAALAILRRLA